LRITPSATALLGSGTVRWRVYAQLDNHFVAAHASSPASQKLSGADETHAVTASISRTHSQCQRSATPKRHLAGRSRI
jgi:hypothetical protein